MDDIKLIEEPRCVYVISVPSSSHLNPTLCFLNDLIKKLHLLDIDKIVVYTDPQFYERILNLPENLKDDKTNISTLNFKNFIECRDLRLNENTGTSNLLKLIMNFDTKANNLFRIFQCFENSFKVACQNIMKNLVNDIHKDKPVLILYDQAIMFIKLTLCLYHKYYSNEKYKPISIAYITTFMFVRGIYPQINELHVFGVTSSIKNMLLTVYDMFRYIIVYYKILLYDLKFSLKETLMLCDSPMAKNFLINSNLNIVFIVPDVHPNIEQFLNASYSHIKFVGASIDDHVRFEMKLNEQISNQEIIATCKGVNELNVELNENEKCLKIIEKFLLKQQCSVDYFKNKVYNYENCKINLKYLRNGLVDLTTLPDGLNNDVIANITSSSSNTLNFYHKPIIYVSMGNTFIYENGYLFDIIIETLKEFAVDYSIIISVGNQKLYEQYNLKYKLNNVLLMPYVPQIEILKRTHLFLTHAGMNSISESIHFGVPIVCIPLSGDQPLIAKHVTNELNVGIRLISNSSLTHDTLRKAINEVLTNPKYRERVTELSEISKRYPGHKIASDLVIEFIRQKNLLNNN